MLSNGEALTETHRDANGRADVLAKAAVQQHRVDEKEVEAWDAAYESAVEAARWIARATHEANNQELFPFQDSEAARWRSDEAATERRKAKSLRSKRLLIIDKLKSMKQRRSPEMGGHIVARAVEGGTWNMWRCARCKARSGSRVEL